MREPVKTAPKKIIAASKPKMPPSPQPPKIAKRKNTLFAAPPVSIDVVVNEQVENAHHQRLQKVVFSQTVIIAILAGLLFFLAPFLQPVYHFYARDPDGNTAPIDGLIMPNMTNRAVLSWAVTSVTEIMTIGFGDFRPKLAAQRPRFTPDGWDSFAAAFHKQKIGESFQQNQLVLTTVPSNVPVILSQGQNEDGIYQWKVQLPVIMTYATNNNVTRRQRGIITLTIVRVPVGESPTGIAIKTWLVEY